MKDPREMELILRESDEIVGGIPGVVLTLNKGFLFPNAGIDSSNAPPGHVVLFPADPKGSATAIRERMGKGKRIGVIIGDSRTHPLRLGCVGVALACSGLEAVEDARGQKDLFGRELKITRKAIADNLVSAAQIVMGEGDEGIPAAIIRDSGVPINEAGGEIPTIPPAECMYIGALGIGPRPYSGGYDRLSMRRQAMARACVLLLPGELCPHQSGNIYSRKHRECLHRGGHLRREGSDGQGHSLERGIRGSGNC